MDARPTQQEKKKRDDRAPAVGSRAAERRMSCDILRERERERERAREGGREEEEENRRDQSQEKDDDLEKELVSSPPTFHG